ncbi:hypothetical protein BO71DRAFT_101638 [Aspergillus ellipticus CBS 707.79]|uniref:Uncharacterized protein n=1 Tax=Aspergillus ellipticus CBS 707.79 TaxID=1448320 RepID=A0A319DJW1_9EURO|nr:hypothetical protein BO71DRAFT_101638 [Aspergillus ellipticus CBS 707.79]
MTRPGAQAASRAMDPCGPLPPCPLHLSLSLSSSSSSGFQGGKRGRGEENISRSRNPVAATVSTRACAFRLQDIRVSGLRTDVWPRGEQSRHPARGRSPASATFAPIHRPHPRGTQQTPRPIPVHPVPSSVRPLDQAALPRTNSGVALTPACSGIAALPRTPTGLGAKKAMR